MVTKIQSLPNSLKVAIFLLALAATVSIGLFLAEKAVAWYTFPTDMGMHAGMTGAGSAPVSSGDAVLWDASGDVILWDASGDAVLWD